MNSFYLLVLASSLGFDLSARRALARLRFSTSPDTTAALAAASTPRVKFELCGQAMLSEIRDEMAAEDTSDAPMHAMDMFRTGGSFREGPSSPPLEAVDEFDTQMSGEFADVDPEALMGKIFFRLFHEWFDTIKETFSECVLGRGEFDTTDMPKFGANAMEVIMAEVGRLVGMEDGSGLLGKFRSIMQAAIVAAHVDEAGTHLDADTLAEVDALRAALSSAEILEPLQSSFVPEFSALQEVVAELEQEMMEESEMIDPTFLEDEDTVAEIKRVLADMRAQRESSAPENLDDLTNDMVQFVDRSVRLANNADSRVSTGSHVTVPEAPSDGWKKRAPLVEMSCALRVASLMGQMGDEFMACMLEDPREDESDSEDNEVPGHSGSPRHRLSPLKSPANAGLDQAKSPLKSSVVSPEKNSPAKAALPSKSPRRSLSLNTADLGVTTQLGSPTRHAGPPAVQQETARQDAAPSPSAKVSQKSPQDGDVTVVVRVNIDGVSA